jgi:hypothetical protein
MFFRLDGATGFDSSSAACGAPAAITSLLRADGYGLTDLRIVWLRLDHDFLQFLDNCRERISRRSLVDRALVHRKARTFRAPWISESDSTCPFGAES